MPGAGITPFIAILRRLYADKKIGRNELFFSNKTSADIILRDELDIMLGPRVHHILTRKDGHGGQGGQDEKHIDKAFLQREIKDFTWPCYICGPDKMVSDLTALLAGLGANPESLVFEK